MTRKNPTINVKTQKKAFIRRYGKPKRGKWKVITITPDMIVCDNIEDGYFNVAPHWLSVGNRTFSTDLKQVGGTQ